MSSREISITQTSATTNVIFAHSLKGKTHWNLRGRAYDLTLEEIQRRTLEAWHRGGVEVCLQGGIHPAMTVTTYLSILPGHQRRSVRKFTFTRFLRLKYGKARQRLAFRWKSFFPCVERRRLGSMPGTAAEILDDEVRAIICPDKITTSQWLHVMRPRIVSG